ncbi:MAG: peptidase M3, partial [Muribaculaceae bacterium]|nr:peptidase M3 [Muribaculaceae bacterium]
MKKLILGLALVTSMNIMAQNPFFEEFKTVHNTPPFSQINAESYPEAIDRAIALNKQEVDMICNQRSTPDFDNTIVALENAGKDLNRVLSVFYNLLEANSDDRMMEISLEVSPKLSDLSTSIMLNER